MSGAAVVIIIGGGQQQNRVSEADETQETTIKVKLDPGDGSVSDQLRAAAALLDGD